MARPGTKGLCPSFLVGHGPVATSVAIPSKGSAPTAAIAALEQQRASAQYRVNLRRAAPDFLRWCSLSKLDVGIAQANSVVRAGYWAHYAQHCPDQGQLSWRARYAILGIQRLLRSFRGQLVRAWDASTSWQRQTPVRSRIPLLPEVGLGIALDYALAGLQHRETGDWSWAVAVLDLVVFVALLRLLEMLASLRAGVATCMYRQNIPVSSIKIKGGWRSDSSLAHDIREAMPLLVWQTISPATRQTSVARAPLACFPMARLLYPGWLVLLNCMWPVHGGIVESVEKTLAFVETGSLWDTFQLAKALVEASSSWLVALLLTIAAVCLRLHFLSVHARQVRGQHLIQRC